MIDPTKISHLGVHVTDRAAGSTLEYESGGLQRWLKLFGIERATGAYVATKVYDEAWTWRSGSATSLSDAQLKLLDDARETGATPVISYCCFTQLHPGTVEDVRPYRTGWRFAAQKWLRTVALLHPGAAVVFCNERESSWKGEAGYFFDLEAEFGQLAKSLGLKWFVGGDLVEANTIETIQQRMAAWRVHSVEPDAIAWHSYGQGGTLFRHVQDIIDAVHRVAGRTFRHVWTEWSWGFPGEGKTRDDRRDLDTAETGAWCGGFALALAAAGAAGTFFSMLILFNREGEPTAAADEFVETVRTGAIVEPRQPPADKARAKTFRYLSAGRSALSAAVARSIARLRAAMA